MLQPKISYDPGTGLTDLTFTFPNVEKPGPEDGTSDKLVAERVDSITLSGKKQSFYIRTDRFRTLKMKYVPFTDLPGWSAFMAYAIQGGSFSYFPDSTIGTSTDYTLEDTDWDPSYAFREFASFTVVMRQLV